MKSSVFSAVLLISIIACPFFSFSQKIILKSSTKPNTAFVTSTVTTSDMLMDFKGSKSIREQLTNAGLNFPLVIKTSGSNELYTKIGAVGKDGNKAFEGTIRKYTATTEVNGKKIETPPDRRDGFRVVGHIGDDDKVIIDTVKGLPMPEMEEQFKKLGYKNAITFPDYAVGVGDVFVNEFPMSMPVAGMKIEMTVKSRYKVVSITAEKVTLDVKQAIEMDVMVDKGGIKMKLTAAGNGLGVAIFDRQLEMVESNDTDMKMSMQIKMDDGKMLVEAKTKVNLIVTKAE
jgi:hypothetical protein